MWQLWRDDGTWGSYTVAYFATQAEADEAKAWAYPEDEDVLVFEVKPESLASWKEYHSEAKP